MGLRDTVQELRELGLSGTLFRVRHELRMRTRATERLERPIPATPARGDLRWRDALPFGDPAAVVRAMAPRLRPDALDALRDDADREARGEVLCFHRDRYDFGRTIDWYLHPISGARWSASEHWSTALRGLAEIGDPKLTWEPARFPQAYRMARAAAFFPGESARLCEAVTAQVEGFLAAAPHPRGLHWFSSQELEIRVAAWCFAAHVFRALGHDVSRLTDAIARHAWEAAHHTERELEYARRAVYNNHLIAEALGLYLFSTIAPSGSDADRWRSVGLALLDEQAGRQFYRDGAYLNLAHNYHRTVLHDYLLASRMRQREGAPIPAPWRAAMERSLDFLVAMQDPRSGALPNYGSNDGSMPRVLSTCDFADFRPTLQAVSLLTRAERIYPAGAHDEEAAWLLGPDALDAPLREPSRRSVSFAETGFHALRGRDPSTFAALRCGTVRDRFGQIDMLHLDVWWRGHNALVDGGTYLYNGERKWLDHFIRTASHNTVTVDGRDQMLHWRQFKFLYWTTARLLRFEDHPTWALAAGEHDGYARHPGGCVHRRAVLLVKDGLLVVVDRVTGEGAHAARLQWLAGRFPHAYDPARAAITIDLPSGPFAVATFDERGVPLAGDVARGEEHPPRGWISREYGHREPTASLAVELRGACPLVMVTVMGDGALGVSERAGVWNVRSASCNVRFRIEDGMIENVKESRE